MSKILEFYQSDEAAIVSRILAQVHKSIDSEFPSAAPTSKRFAKTIFTNDEPTVNQFLPHETNEGKSATNQAFTPPVTDQPNTENPIGTQLKRRTKDRKLLILGVSLILILMLLFLLLY